MPPTTSACGNRGGLARGLGPQRDGGTPGSSRGGGSSRSGAARRASRSRPGRQFQSTSRPRIRGRRRRRSGRCPARIEAVNSLQLPALADPIVGAPSCCPATRRSGTGGAVRRARRTSSARRARACRRAGWSRGSAWPRVWLTGGSPWRWVSRAAVDGCFQPQRVSRRIQTRGTGPETSKWCGFRVARARVAWCVNPLPPLPGVQAFEAAARLGSFAAAAAELHLSPAAVSQRIRSLETHLGVPLFERLARSVELTELGRAYLPSVRESLDDLAAATGGLFAPARREQLTVRHPGVVRDDLARPAPAPVPSRATRDRPASVCSVWSEALTPGEVDLDIHQGRGAWPGVHARLLHHDDAVVVHGPAPPRPLGPDPRRRRPRRPTPHPGPPASTTSGNASYPPRRASPRSRRPPSTPPSPHSTSWPRVTPPRRSPNASPAPPSTRRPGQPRPRAVLSHAPGALPATASRRPHLTAQARAFLLWLAPSRRRPARAAPRRRGRRRLDPVLCAASPRRRGTPRDTKRGLPAMLKSTERPAREDIVAGRGPGLRDRPSLQGGG